MQKITTLFFSFCLFLTACLSLNNLIVTDFKESVFSTNYPLKMQIQHVQDSLYRIHYYIITKNLQKRQATDETEYYDFSIEIRAFQSFRKNKLCHSDSVNYKNCLRKQLQDTLFLSSDILLPPNQNCAIELILKDFNNKKFWNVVETTSGSISPNHQNIILKDISGNILFRNYLIENESVIIETDDTQLQFNARAALPTDVPEPPFGCDKKQKTVEPNKAIQPYSCNSIFTPSFHGLLLSNKSITIPIFPNSYPDLSKWDKINVLRYICTEQEFQLIREKQNPDIAWGLFISEGKGSKEAVKNKEARFYEAAKTANLLFTEDRFGWMTDRGMIFIVFGMPSKVVRSDGYQSWIYDKTDNPFDSFRFDFMENPSKTGYELIRSEHFRIAWFQAVENWRIR